MPVEVVSCDVVVVGGGGAGLRAAIAAAAADPGLSIALVSKVVPMRSHTVAAEGGAAGVIRDDDSPELHFDDTVSGGDWLCDQDSVAFFVEACAREMVQLEHWGCPWSRRRAFSAPRGLPGTTGTRSASTVCSAAPPARSTR